jgi:hypothetical protein
VKPVGQYKVMAGGNWNPACADDGGCQLEECKNTMACRPEEPNKLEVFVMSQCPCGVKGLDAMKEVLENFKKNDAKIDFEIHFIGDGDAKTGLKAMHGQSEVDENIREICAIKHYPDNYKYMDYIWCRNKNIKESRTPTGSPAPVETPASTPPRSRSASRVTRARSSSRRATRTPSRSASARARPGSPTASSNSPASTRRRSRRRCARRTSSAAAKTSCRARRRARRAVQPGRQRPVVAADHTA